MPRAGAELILPVTFRSVAAVAAITDRRINGGGARVVGRQDGVNQLAVLSSHLVPS